MFNWVRKTPRIEQNKIPNTKAVNVSLNMWAKKNDNYLKNVSKFIIKFDELYDKYAAHTIAELKEIYKENWGKPSNFVNDRATLIYLIARKQVTNEWEQ